MRVFLFCYGIWRGGFAAEDIMADTSSGASPKLPANLELQRTRVVCAVDAPSYVRHFLLPSSFFLFRLQLYCIFRRIHLRIIGGNRD